MLGGMLTSAMMSRARWRSIDDSPRWHLVHGQPEQALRVLSNLARRNGTAIPPAVRLREAAKAREKAFLKEVLRVGRTRKWILIAVFCW